MGRRDRRLEQAEREPGDERALRVEPRHDSSEQPVEPVARRRVRVERGRGGREHGGEAGPDAGEGEGCADEELHGQADQHGCVEVLGDRLERSAEPGSGQQSSPGGGEQQRSRGNEQRPCLDRRAADVPEPVVAQFPERQRVGKDVGRPVEEDEQHRADREGDGERRRDPPDHRAARPVRLDRQEVRACARCRGYEQPDDEGEDESAPTDARLRDGSRACRDHERREHAERDQLAEGEMDDTGQPEDERLPDGDEPVDGAGRESARENLEDDRHGGLSLPG